jgi:hypothetical protein
MSILGLVHASSAAEDHTGTPVKTSSESRGESSPRSVQAETESSELPLWRDFDRWSFQVGLGIISGSTIDEILVLDGERAEGDAEGEIHFLQVSYKVAAFKPVVFGQRVDVDLELPLVLAVVDERGRDPFMQYNVGLTLRWKSFPWNNWLYTNFETGCGLTYSSHVLEAERQRHPSRDRSHLEFYWPSQLMLAHPRYREHQLVLFLHHHSGGAIFHRGGANTLGIGYRFVPGERQQ